MRRPPGPRSSRGVRWPCAERTATVEMDSYEVVHLLERIINGTGEVVEATHELLVLGREEHAPPDDTWEGFLEEHQELTTSPAQKARLEFSDEELVEALLEAIRRWNEDKLPKLSRPRMPRDRETHSSDVAKVLANGAEVTFGDVVRVGQRLGRLARAGRITRIVEPYSPLRYSVSDDA
jgi:hypothetical protein